MRSLIGPRPGFRLTVALAAICATALAAVPTSTHGCSATGTYRDITFPLHWRILDHGDGSISVFAANPNDPTAAIITEGTRVGDTLYFGDILTAAVRGALSLDCMSISVTGLPLPTILLRLRDGVCGDGVRDDVEECDDGNFVNGDDCTAACEIAGCGDRIVSPPEECDDGNTVGADGCSPDCRACGNSVIDTDEECDDGNLAVGDGCDAYCQLQACPNGELEPGEECDDGNTVPGDGCTPTCLQEGCSLTGTWSGPSPSVSWRFLERQDGTFNSVLIQSNSTFELSGQRVRRDVLFAFAGLTGFQGTCDTLFVSLPNAGFSLSLVRIDSVACGDGVLGDGEQCDDGNFTNADGCQANCRIQGCGDGFVSNAEECDDGNSTDGDGCSSACASCGNGVVGVAEECDDGNGTAGDGCEPGCVITPCHPTPLAACAKLSSRGRSRLRIRDTDRSERDVLSWTWTHGDSDKPSSFPSPLAGTSYRLCVFEDASSSIAFEADIPGSGFCAEECWDDAGSNGYRYANARGTPDGVVSATLNPRRRGGEVTFRGKGAFLSGRTDGLPSLPVALPLRAQLQASDGRCWEARYVAAKRNRPTDLLTIGGSPSGAFVTGGRSTHD